MWNSAPEQTKKSFTENRRRLGEAYIRLGTALVAICDRRDAVGVGSFGLFDEFKLADADVKRHVVEDQRLVEVLFPGGITEEEAAGDARLLNAIRTGVI